METNGQGIARCSDLRRRREGDAPRIALDAVARKQEKRLASILGCDLYPLVTADAVGVILPRKTHMYQLQLAAQVREDQLGSARSGVGRFARPRVSFRASRGQGG